jgi:WD40 repeat protein
MRHNVALISIGLLILSLVGADLVREHLVSAAEVSFSREVAPILVRRCLGCHDNRKSEGRYALHAFDRLIKGGDSEESPIIPGNPDESYLFQKLIESDPDLRMPQEDSRLADAQITLIRRWIKEGARFDGADPTSQLTTLLPPREHPASPKTYRVPIPVFALKFSPDGDSLVTGGWHELLVWDANSGVLIRRVGGMPQRIQAVTISPDGQTIAVCGGAPGEYGEIRIVPAASVFSQSETNEPGPVHVLPAWEDVVLDAQFTPDSNRLIACGADNSVRCYDVADRAEVWHTRQHADWVTAVDVTSYRFSETMVSNEPDNSLLTLNEDDRKSKQHIRQCWNFGDGHFVMREANWELEVTPPSTSTATATADIESEIRLTRITVSGIGKTYKVLREPFSDDKLKPHAAVIDYLNSLYESWGSNSASDRFVVSASRDRTVKVFSLADGQLFTTYKGHRREYGPLAGLHRVFGVQAAQGNRRVWSGGEGKHFHGWDPVTVRDEDGTAADMEARFSKEYSTDLLRHEFAEPVFSLVRRGNRLIAGSADGQVRGYAISGSEVTFSVNNTASSLTFGGQSDHIFAVDADNFGNRVAAVGFRGEVVIWNRESQQTLNRFIASPVSD